MVRRHGGNNGILLKAANSASTAFYSSEAATANGKPYFSVTYRNSTGIEDTWTYYSQQAGRAGTGSVNLFSGNLTWSHADASITNGAMGVAVSHVYNANDKDTDMGYGHGWRVNYAQDLVREEIATTEGTVTHYRLTDGDGTRHWYKHDTGSEYVSELDKDSTLTINGDHTATVKDKGDNTMTFALDGTDSRGRLTGISDAAGNRTLVTYTANDTDADGNLTEEAAGDLRIATVQEALNGQAEADRQTVTFRYGEDGHLTQVTPPDGLTVTYAYADGDLVSVTYADRNTAGFTYAREDAENEEESGAGASRHLLTKAENIDGYNLAYAYTAGAPYRVTKVTENNGSADGQHLDFAYTRQQTTVTDRDDHNVTRTENDSEEEGNKGRRTVYALDYVGQTVSVTDGADRAVYAAYGTGDREVTQLGAVSKTQDTVYNLLGNHGFEDGSTRLTGWDNAHGSLSTSEHHTGRKSAKVSAGGYISQAVHAGERGTYTLSAWVKGAGATLSAGGVTGEASVSGDWERIHVTFTAGSGTVTARLDNGGSASVYVDDVQLEKGEVPSRYNLVGNSAFTEGLSSWTVNYPSDNGTAEDARFGTVAALRKPQQTSTLEQKLNYAGSAGDTYSVGVWVKCEDYPETQQLYWYQQSGTWKTHYQTLGKKRVKLEFRNASGTVVSSAYRDLTPGTTGWQFLSFGAVATHSYSSVYVVAEYGFALDTMYIDGVQVFREEFSQGYTYDAKGNLKRYTSLLGQSDSFDYDDHDNVTEATDALGNETRYTYYGADSTGNPTGNTHLVKDVTTPEGVKTAYTYNGMGQVLETKTGNATLYVSSSTAYDTAGMVTSVTDARGNSAAYAYNGTTRQAASVTDALGNVTAYGYGNAAEMLRLAEAVSAGTGKVSYGYDAYGRLTEVARNKDAGDNAIPGTVYRMAYDAWGRNASTAVGSLTLSTNAYDDHGRLTSVTYGNGYRVEYAYDTLDRVSTVSRGTGSGTALAFTYVYDGEGNLHELRDHGTGRSTFFTYDHAGRCMASEEKAFTESGGAVTYTGTVSSYGYEYDACNRLSKLSCTTDGSAWETVYTYDRDGKAKTVTLDNGKVITNTHDALGRLRYRDIGLTMTYRTELTYLAGAGTNSTTALLESYKNGSDDAYAYAYDANGNITSVTQGSAAVTYTYNAANELIREDNGFTNETVTYSYDPWGNLLEKVTHAYGTATPVKTVTYSYGNTDWRDELTGISTVTGADTVNEQIVYDANGNAVSYRGATLSWEEKQLAAYTKDGIAVTYAYDVNGLRLRKTVNGETTDYYYNGSILMSLVTGDDILLFSYDQAGNVVSVNHNGTEYYYLRNGQGDITALIDGTGAKVTEYVYNSWGEVISLAGSHALDIGTLNPFRYRGYVYDEETQLYYLQSRYYDPELCRFISADVLLSTGQGVLGHNSFAYCLNDPICMTDASGGRSVVAELCSGNNSDEDPSDELIPSSPRGNCYQYATGMPYSIFGGGVHTPGTARGEYGISGKYTDKETLREAIQDDYDVCFPGKKYSVISTDYASKIADNEIKIVYCYSDERQDFHFLRFSNNSGWTHKKGKSILRKPTNLDYADEPKPIGDIKEAVLSPYEIYFYYIIRVGE